MSIFILEKTGLVYVDVLADDTIINGLNPSMVMVKATSLVDAQTKAKDVMIDQLWAVVNNWVDNVSGFDDKFQKKCISWKSDSGSSPTRLQRIADMEAWSDTIWQEYARIRAKYENSNFSEDFNPTSILPRPWTFWDVAGV